MLVLFKILVVSRKVCQVFLVSYKSPETETVLYATDTWASNIPKPNNNIFKLSEIKESFIAKELKTLKKKKNSTGFANLPPDF